MIPEKFQTFCKEVGKLARLNNLSSLDGHIHPSWEDKWRETIHFTWQEGRHGAESDKIHMESTRRIQLNIDNKSIEQDK